MNADSLVAELHARPAPRFSSPATVCYLAFREVAQAVTRDTEADLSHGLKVEGHVEVETHSEYVAYLSVVPGRRGPLFDPERSPFTAEWQQAAAGERLVAIMVEVTPLTVPEEEVVAFAGRYLDATSLVVSWVADRGIAVATDFRLDDAGIMRFLVLTTDAVGPGRTGRVARRLLDIETYRALAMLGFLEAKDLQRSLNEIHPRLIDLTSRMDDPAHTTDETLHEFLSVSADLEGLASRLDFRFGATHAYASIVTDRVASLGETHLGGRQTIGEFLQVRHEPAMRTVFASEQRLERMTERAGRAGALLRARVDVARSAQNQVLLQSLDQRSETQLRLQHAVEGLSVVAVSYYAVALLGYPLAPLAHVLNWDKTWLQALLTPLVVAAVWFGLWRTRKSLTRGR